MSRLRKILLAVAALVVVVILFALAGGWYIARSVVPKYQGEASLPFLTDSVDVHFDDYGIPHINATNRLDAYRTLGYLMARERLFQMEMIRRVGQGRLAEVVGEAALESDIFYRHLHVGEHAKRSANDFLNEGPPEAVAECEAFLEGINAFIETGPKPIEFRLIGIPMETYEPHDIYTLAGYMAWSFSLAVQTDLLAHELAMKHGQEWLVNKGLDADELLPHHPVCNTSPSPIISSFPDFFGKAGIPEFNGSNAWAVAPQKSANGKAILCNDTHIGYGVPQVWYEAAIQTPDMHLYGNFLPGIPYALAGHSNTHAWGLTMFENDDIDFYIEQRDEAGNFVYDLGNYPPSIQNQSIKIKGRPDTLIAVISSKHGCVINSAVSTLKSDQPISMHWEYLRGRNRLLEAFRAMNTAQNMAQFERGPERIHAPGLNVVYADNDGNIAWWASARLAARPEGVSAKLPVDGTVSANEYLGYLDFSHNPQCVNPPSGFVYSANEQPAAVDSVYVPGYYVPPTRSKRIERLLNERNDWDMAGMQNLLLDVVNDDDAAASATFAKLMTGMFDDQPGLAAFANLFPWNGSYAVDQAAPVLYQPLQVALMRSALQDDLSDEQFVRITSTHWFRRWMVMALSDPNHATWDLSSTDSQETLSDHLRMMFPLVCEQVAAEHGNDPSTWRWGLAHRFMPQHPLSMIPFIGDWLSIDPIEVPGSNETINQSGFTPTLLTSVKAKYGPQMRIVVDFADVNGSVSVGPVGQSGHKLSPHYNDQVALYTEGRFRRQRLVPEGTERRLRFRPAAESNEQP